MKNTSLPRRLFGFVAASPSESLVLQRLGRIRLRGRGAAAWILPGLDRAFLIPTTVQSADFLADQVTLENQGVEIDGFALWHISDPAKAIEVVDFTSPEAALADMGERLRALIEAGIRREVANLTLEQVLRQRAAMTHLLGDELAGLAERWGITVAAVEIRRVRILSKQLFENMQAEFRNAQRLASARSALETDEAIARAQAADRESAAQRELAFRLAEIEREGQARREEIAREVRLNEARERARRDREIASLDTELQLVQAREERSAAARAAKESLIEIEESLEVRRQQSERLRVKHQEQIAAIKNVAKRRDIETENLKDRGRLLIEALPEALSNLTVGTLNLGDPILATGVQALLQSLLRESQEEKKH